MSLINQMLRDLEQRNTQKPKPTQALDVRTAAQPASGRPSRLWLLGLTALPLAYLWQLNSASQPAQPPAAPAAAGVNSEPQPAAATEPPPVIAATEPSRGESPTSPIHTFSAAPNAILVESQKFSATPGKVNQQPASPVIPQAANQAVLPAPAPTGAPIKRPKATETSTPHESAEALYRQAQRSVSALMRRENLKEALQQDPRHLPARTLLLQTLIKSHADTELGEFVDASLALFPSNLLFIKTRAHLYVQQKNFIAAIDVLERADADAVNDSAYLALLAAGYQQLQRFPQAVRLYQRLTQTQPEKAENWLGLAIAQDKLNQSQSATRSYRQALDKKTLNADVVSYINQRLSALDPVR